MKNLNVSQPQAGGATTFHFESARALAYSMAESDAKLLEPALIAWFDRSSAMASPVLEGCSGPNGWHDYGISHGGYLEVDVDDKATFIFAESSQFDSYEHLGPGPYVNIRDTRGNEMICELGGKNCSPIDDWTSKLT